MPILTMLTKFGSGAAMLTTYSASFGDENIFPSKKRATAIGICNIIARSVTIFAPQVNELQAPIPMLFFIASVSFALIISFSLYHQPQSKRHHRPKQPSGDLEGRYINKAHYETSNTTNCKIRVNYIPNTVEGYNMYYQGIMNLNESKSIDKLHDILEDRLNKESSETSYESRSVSLYSMDNSVEL
jgi:hypothetical protein